MPEPLNFVPQERPRPGYHPVGTVVLILITTFIGFAIVGPAIGFFVALPFYDGDGMQLVEAITPPLTDPALRIPMFILQGFATAVGLIAGPLLLMFVLKKSVTNLFTENRPDIGQIILTIGIVVLFMGFNSAIIDWNEKLDLPDLFQGFETWAREKEDLAAEITRFMTQLESPALLLMGLLVIAILPAIGEELVFRGLIQREMFLASKNMHLSIWFTAFVFSAFHMQFYGLVPRMLLGALFGYLYHWSGSLTISILAHFVNNGFAIVGLYLYQHKQIEFNIESNESLPWPYVVGSAIVTVLLLFYFKKYSQEHKPTMPS